MAPCAVQTVDLGVEQVPTVLLVLPVSGANGVKPLWWWDSRLGAGSFTDAIASFGKVWPRRGRFPVVHAGSESYNESGVNYVAIALFDPAGRYVIPFAVSKATAEDNYTHQLRHSQTGALAATLTPDFVFGGAAFNANTDPVRASLYRGPGHGGDLPPRSAWRRRRRRTGSRRSDPGRCNFGTAIGQHGGDTAFWAGRVSDGVSSARLLAATSYVGDGATARNVTRGQSWYRTSASKRLTVRSYYDGLQELTSAAR